jgi:hypothetical protein
VCGLNGTCVSCGVSGNPCCPNNTCSGGGCCFYNQGWSLCTAEAATCGGAAASCSASACGGCGGLGQNCCVVISNYVCTAPNTYCTAQQPGGICNACGGMGQPCCGSASISISDGSTCNAGLTCHVTASARTCGP